MMYALHRNESIQVSRADRRAAKVRSPTRLVALLAAAVGTASPVRLRMSGQIR